jgi:hypothetical protein
VVDAEVVVELVDDDDVVVDADVDDSGPCRRCNFYIGNPKKKTNNEYK